MNILVLGGNGYLGSKITRELLMLGHSIVCTKRNASDISRLTDINDCITWISATVEAVETAMIYMKFDCVVNLICNYGRSNVLYDNVIEANIEFPLQVLNISVKNRVNSFITIGTGLPDDLNMYSFSKKMLNEFGLFYAKKHNINYCSLRLEMFYGADEPSDRFLPNLIRSMLKGHEVNTTLGTQKRDIISIRDIVNAVLMVIEETPKGYNEIPVGTGDAPTIEEIVDFIWNKTGQKSIVNKGAVQMREKEPDCVADITKIKNIGAWSPILWQEGISEMIDEIAEEIEGEKNEDIN